MDCDECDLRRSNMLRRRYIWIRYVYAVVAGMVYLVFPAAPDLGDGVGFAESH